MKAVRFMEGFMIGGLLGAAMALLLSPSSGVALRDQIQSEVERVRSDVNRAAAERRAEMERQLAALRAPKS